MKKHPIRSVCSLLLSAVMLLGMLSALTTPAVAGMKYQNVDLDFDTDTATVYYSCGNCGAYYEVDCSIDDFYNDGYIVIIEADCTDIELNTDYCQMCFLDHVCMECLTPIEECESFCYNCHQCWDCETDNHCTRCGQCTHEMCQECLAAGVHLCVECHEDYAQCEGCGRCLYALMTTEEVCFNEQTKDTHCTTCDEPWICIECGYCFYHREEWFCSTCDMCLECAREAGLHCRHCVGCFESEVEHCEASEDLCIDCCVEAGNHCDVCSEHVDDWCEGGKDCRHCADCAADQNWICENCGQCVVCNDLENCEDCGYCMECCLENRADAGCECLEFCPESADFENEEHMCAQCMSHFSCENDFCGFCGLCEDCCRDNAEAEGCVCGLCVEDSEFDQHICSQCGEPTCTRGDFCDTCGLCASCCLENSEAEGCECGICVESDAFEDAFHKCSACGKRFSCSVDFCASCGLCEYCCKDDPATATYHGTNTAPGTIYIQPTAKRRTVSRNTIYDRAENTASFRVRAYDPNGSLQYQWYYKVDGGAPVKLVNESRQIGIYDETLVFVGGADTDTLTVAVPCDACHREYSYYCVISDGSGKTLSTSDPARLYASHNYAWQRLDDDFHQKVCVGEGCTETEGSVKKAHEVGSWRFLSYATATEGAKMVRSCNVCGSVSESTVTDPLGADHTSHDYIYTPVMATNSAGDPVSNSHVRRCRCGRQDGGEETHVWGMWIVTEPATENKRGSKYHECLLCGYRETVVIQRQTHEHLWNLHNYEEEFYLGGWNSRTHFQYCGDPDCKATAFVEPHVFSNWSWQTESGTPNLGLKDATIKRTCEICGYVQQKTIHQDYRPLCFANANLTAVSADNRWSSSKYTCTVSAAPPPGYYFTHWENIGQGPIKYEEYHVEEPYVGTVWYSYDKDDETIVISLDNYGEDGSYLPLETIYELRANVERYDNNITLYDTNRTPVFCLTPGDEIEDNGLFSAASLQSDAGLMSGGRGVIWYESQEEDAYGYRTVTLHLNGYNGGAIELDDTGLPCNLNIIVDGDSDITTTGQQGILGCLTGGDVTISSPNGSELRINVRSGKEDCYGIRTGRSRQYHSDKLTLCGSVNVQINVTDTFGSSTGAAYGLYSNSWVAIEDSASAEISVGSYAYDVAYDGQVLVSAAAIHASKELQLNTTGHLFIDATNVDVPNGRKGLGIDAKNTIIDNIGRMEVTYPQNTRAAYNHEPTYDPRSFIFCVSDDGTRNFFKNGVAVSSHAVKRLLVEPGYPVHFDVNEGGTLNVESVYRNAEGDYLVRPGEDLVFYTAPAPGRCNEIVLVDGSSVKPGATDDGVRTKYVLEAVSAPHTVSVGSGILFAPFASQPELSQENVYFGSEAQLSYRMNDVLRVLQSHEKFGGSASADPKYALGGSAGSYASGELIKGSQTINQVFLQYRNELSGEYENTGVSFAPSIVSSVGFNDEKNAAALKTVRYRLMVLYDGREYTSDDFTVHWTDDPNDTAEPMTTAVELYVRDGRFANGAHCVDGGAWVRLDSVTDVLAFDVDASVGFAETSAIFNRDVAKGGRKLLKFAEFDYHSGTLTLFGDFPAADFDGDGEDESFDLNDQLMAIRVPDDASGGLVINVLADATVDGSFEEFGWEGWYDSHGNLAKREHTYGQTSVILNESEGGFVRVTSRTGADLTLNRRGDEVHKSDERAYYGIKAAGGIRVDGSAGVAIELGANYEYTSTKNYAANRYGLSTEGELRVGDSASVHVNLPVPETSRRLKGDALAADAAAVSLTGDSVTRLICAADYEADTAAGFALKTGALNVTGSARLIATGKGDIPTPIRVDGNALWATDGEIEIHALGEGTAVNAAEAGGELRIMMPTTVKLEYRGGAEETGLLVGGEAVFDGDFICYRTAGGETEPSEESYYPGIPYSVKAEIDEGAESYGPVIKVTRDGKTLHESEALDSVDVCMGDTVSFTAADAWGGYAFSGWEVDSKLLPDDLVISGATISFTMPDRDVPLHAVYTCEAFDSEPPCFVFTNSASTEGTLYWRVDSNAPALHDVELEYLTVNESGESEWRSFRYYETGEARGWSLRDDMEKLKNAETGDNIYRGASVLRLGGGSADRTIDTDRSTTYRIYAWGGVWYYSRPFTIDPKNGVHVLLSQDAASPDVVIPADYVGTEYVADLSKYLYSDDGSMTYALTFDDLSGPIDGSVCDAAVYENGMLRFVRSDAHDAVHALSGGAYVSATDGKSGRVFKIPFEFGEIYDAELYPLIVSGRKVTDHNKDDVLGDGTVSYDPASGVLKLNNAHIDEIYPVRSDGDLMSAAYAIVGAKDLTIELTGENSISVGRSSFCGGLTTGSSFSGTIVGIGSAVNDDWRPYLAADDDFRVNFTGSGSLALTVDGDDSEAIHALGDVTVSGGTLDLRAKYSGISSENGSFTMDGGTLSVDVKQLSCLSLPDPNARLTVNGGSLDLNGGTESGAVSMAPENYGNAENFRINGGEMILATKSAAHGVSSRDMYFYDANAYAVLDKEGRNACEVVEAPNTIRTLAYLKFVRQYPIWVNGERFRSDQLKIACGNGSAVYEPETNTIQLNSAKITRGVADWAAGARAAGIYSEQPVNLSFSGYSKIDLSGRDYVSTAGEPVAPADEETEKTRQVYGVYVENRSEEEDPVLALSGTGTCTIRDVRTGISAYQVPISVNGPKLLLSNCEGGIDGDVNVRSGALTIAASDYSIYGALDTRGYAPLYAYGGTSRSACTALTPADVGAGAEAGQVFAYTYFRLGSEPLSEQTDEIGEILSEEAGETRIRIHTASLPEVAHMELIVAQYRAGELTDTRVISLDAADMDEAINLSFGTIEDAEYRVFVLDDDYTPLTDDYELRRKDP